MLLIPQRYEFSSKSQLACSRKRMILVVADTTKVRIFKQITTTSLYKELAPKLLLIPQRYEFSSKSQRMQMLRNKQLGCCWYHKGTNFQANHNAISAKRCHALVVADTTKVRIFKQITTNMTFKTGQIPLLLIPQRYEFSSKSQRVLVNMLVVFVVADTTKVRIFKQITTVC